MISSIHRTFASDRGSTRWWAALASAALIVASAALPAVAADGDPSVAEEITISEPAEAVPESEVTAPETEAAEQESPPVVEAQEAAEKTPAEPVEALAVEAAAEPAEEVAEEAAAEPTEGVAEEAPVEPAPEPAAKRPAAEEPADVVAPSDPAPAEPQLGEASEQITQAPEVAAMTEAAPALRSMSPEPDPIIVQDPSAAGVTPVPRDLNPSAACIDLGYDYGFKVEAENLDYDGPLNGVPGSRLTVDLSTATLGEVIAWTSTNPIGAVLVKGGELSNVYTYVPSANADSLLHSPTNTNNGTYPQVSNVSFCWNDQGYLELEKAFAPGTSGFAGTFAVDYTCGAYPKATVELAAGATKVVGPFDVGTECTVTEPILPIAPTEWTFGTPVITGSPATIVKGDQAAAVLVTVTNSITRDQGYLEVAKAFDPAGSGFVGTFSVVYACGTAAPVTVELAAGASTTVGPFPTGTVCTITEPAVPTAPSGWVFGTPVVAGSPATIVKGGPAAAVLVTVTNSITRDQGYLKVTKAFDPLTSGFAGAFSVVYACGTASPVTVTLAAGASTTVGPFPTGTVCTITEPAVPTAPSGWTFGTPSITGSPATIVKGGQAAAVLVTVANSITRDQGYLKMTKAFDPLTSGFAGTFSVVYQCGDNAAVTVPLAAGASTTVGPFPTGTVCNVSEPAVPTAPSRWTFGTPSVTGSPATIVKGDQATAILVTVTNTISEEVIAGTEDVADSDDEGEAVVAAEETLASTGADNVGTTLTAALLAMLAGVLMVAASRRRAEARR